jgi:hypothetical protein
MCSADVFFCFCSFEQRRLGDVSVSAINSFDGDDQKSESVPEFCIDAGSTGNIARFINHSCEPNLFVQCVLSSHHDVKLARVMLFAADNIPPMQVIHYFSGSVGCCGHAQFFLICSTQAENNRYCMCMDISSRPPGMGGKLFLIPKIAWLENIKPEFNHFGHATDFRRQF